MKISEILAKKGSDVFTLEPDDKICGAINQFSERKIGSAVIVDKTGRIAGIFTERDALHCFKEKLDFKKIPVKQMMTPQEDLIVASPDDDIQYVMSMMTEYRIKHIPIVFFIIHSLYASTRRTHTIICYFLVTTQPDGGVEIWEFLPKFPHPTFAG